ncbi:hypothetical protein GLOIN_2v1076656 [Rhizophagus irregularis DAOM 181602=DAOM 197198]|uniref:Uncharacterized protein n=1 Tax=Rhizophagus irregularis (strain DAOM 181602 / DAOM 197198 / MUCL 43194) TaxID=747089 RepID=A0A2P4Q878_RHIID|nr:hypothetical protein GLOIN_2v1076656 [Rhizophagus irregularis DAOM 181602=DAOM 197198]POG73834.1 hypothetical protein GLOIN_2v1076656 [Rhizophagus irregularis DAOM 181602=DAOM 197198]GET51229.1 hypothetical protein GLOIN_2v1076656 [Rhizophagus irregularis DAOM 181602=DAOM 197198]|eukprot:XP_025180700.1 hypothetical protein GLOIN_2v1076656 [Rhizophagus irregularis DAOM 181602=DAOM 197198]
MTGSNDSNVHYFFSSLRKLFIFITHSFIFSKLPIRNVFSASVLMCSHFIYVEAVVLISSSSISFSFRPSDASSVTLFRMCFIFPSTRYSFMTSMASFGAMLFHFRGILVVTSTLLALSSESKSELESPPTRHLLITSTITSWLLRFGFDIYWPPFF